MNLVEQIRERLTRTLEPSQLIVSDDSADHLGHAGAAAGGGHYSVYIVAQAFHNKNRVQRHQMVYQALGNLMQAAIHALRIDAKTDEEAKG